MKGIIIMAENNEPQGLWACDIAYCNYIYNPKIGDPDQGIPEGTSFEDLPEEWRCPICHVGTDCFHPHEL